MKKPKPRFMSKRAISSKWIADSLQILLRKRDNALHECNFCRHRITMSYSDSPCNSCFGAGTTRTKFQSPKKYKDTQKVWLEQINGRFVDDMKWLLDVIEGRIRLLATDDSTRR